MHKIAPSLLSADFGRIAEEITAVQAAGADLLHLDVMDGHFVPNLTFGTPVVRAIAHAAGLPLDAHLMVTNPEDYVEPFAQLGVSMFSVHQEVAWHLHRLMHHIKGTGMMAGVALNPATPVETLRDILADLDFVLLMSVNPGFGGQSFLPLVYDKIRRLRIMRSDLVIEVDGGVNNANAPLLVQAGADILVAGSYVFGSADYAAAIRSLR